MTRTTATPEAYSVFNEFDRHGVLLDLPRVDRERNPEYKRRLLDVFVNRSSSTYRGLINGITRRLGLSIYDAMTISPVVDSDDDPLLSSPAIEFIDTRCRLYRDYINEDILLDIDRYTRNAGGWTLGELRDTINGTGYFTATLSSDAEEKTRSMVIFNQESVNLVENEGISGSGSVIVLENNNLVEGTVTVESGNLRSRVSSESELTSIGSYTIVHKDGVVISRGAPSPGSVIRYKYRNDSFIAQASPVIIHNLQSDTFRNYMFENTGEDNEDNYGLPTKLGADVINELMSVYPANYGE